MLTLTCIKVWIDIVTFKFFTSFSLVFGLEKSVLCCRIKTNLVRNYLA